MANKRKITLHPAPTPLVESSTKDMPKPACQDCVYYEASNANYGICHRYPAATTARVLYWCAEFKMK